MVGAAAAGDDDDDNDSGGWMSGVDKPPVARRQRAEELAWRARGRKGGLGRRRRRMRREGSVACSTLYVCVSVAGWQVGCGNRVVSWLGKADEEFNGGGMGEKERVEWRVDEFDESSESIRSVGCCHSAAPAAAAVSQSLGAVLRCMISR